MKRLFLALAAMALVAGCGVRNPDFAPPAEMAQYAFQNNGPTTLTLYTVVNRNSGAGAHTALQVNASERVIFDPAGSFAAETVPRSGDVLYGANPGVEKAFASAHARKSHLVRKVTIPVSPAVAEMALQRVKSNGAVGAAHCAQSTSSILKSLPGFEDVDITYYPKQLESQLVSRPGASTEQIVEDD